METEYIFISPHLDDAVLSCGELIYKLVNNKNAKCKILTIFTGSIKSHKISCAIQQFHLNCQRGRDLMLFRKQEDAEATKILNCTYEHLEFPECIYRTNEEGAYIYPKLDQIYKYNPAQEKYYEEKIENILFKKLKDKINTEIYAPLSIGNHVDHVITNKIMYQLSKKIPGIIYYYEDVPYIFKVTDKTEEMKTKTKQLKMKIIKISDSEWQRKILAVLLYKSQMHVMWKNVKAMISEMDNASHRYSRERSIRVWQYK